MKRLIALKEIILFTSVFLFLTLFFTGCSTPPEEIKGIESFIENVLTVPSEDFVKLVKENSPPEDMDKFNSELMNAINNIIDEKGKVEKLSDSSSRFFNDVVMLHIMAAQGDYSYKVKNVSVKKSKDNQFTFEAVLINNNNEESSITGTVQTDDNDLVDFMKINENKLFIN